MAIANLALRFIVELGGIIAVGYWGLSASGLGAGRFVLAIVAPAAVIAVWALFIAPTAGGPLSPAARGWVGTLVLLGAAGTLALAGQPTAAIAFAAIVLVNQVLLVVLGPTDLTSLAVTER